VSVVLDVGGLVMGACGCGVSFRMLSCVFGLLGWLCVFVVLFVVLLWW